MQLLESTDLEWRADWPEAFAALQAVRELLKLADEERGGRVPLDPGLPALHSYLRMKIGEHPHEVLLALLADEHGGYFGELTLASGGTDCIRIDPERVVKEIGRRRAAGFLLAHNHPSGECRPSRDDRRSTAVLRELAGRNGIALIDHLVVTPHAVCAIRGEAS